MNNFKLVDVLTCMTPPDTEDKDDSMEASNKNF